MALIDVDKNSLDELEKLYKVQRQYDEALVKWYISVCLKAFNEEMQSITTKEKAVEIFRKVQTEVYEKELAANKAAIKLEIVRKIYKSFDIPRDDEVSND